MADITNPIWSEVDAENNSSGLQPGYPEGMNPSVVNDASRALMGALKRWYDRNNPTVTSTGSANEQVITYTTNPLSYVIGDVYRFVPGYTNTAATTLEIGSLGDVSILCHGLPLVGGEIVEDVVAVVAFDSSNNFQLLNPQNRIFGDLKVAGDMEVGGDAIVTGDLTANTLEVAEDVSVSGDLHVTGGVFGNTGDFSGDVSVGGDETIVGSLTVGDDLTVTDDLTVSGDEHITGKLYLAGKTININGSDIVILPADVAFYISATGDDTTGDGTLAHPWQTAMHAYSVIAGNTNFGTHTVTIYLLPGIYNATSTFFGAVVGNWAIQSTTGSAADVSILVTGFQQDGIHAGGNATILAQNITVGAAGGYALVSSGPSQLNLDGVNVNASGSHIVSYDGGNVDVLGNYAILGDATFHYQCEHGTLTASQSADPVTVSTSGTIAFTAFAHCSDGGYIRAVGWGFGPGGATGARYALDSNAVIQSGGGDEADFFPGDTSGAAANGGVWV